MMMIMILIGCTHNFAVESSELCVCDASSSVVATSTLEAVERGQ